jgi:uncharacterized membrane protein YphA (DoxX/SURF4 family)
LPQIDESKVESSFVSGGKHMKVPFLLGRLLFGGFFLYNGINHLKERKTLGQYAQSKNVPQPEAMVAASGVLLLAGGASILLGIKPKYGAAAIIGFLLGVSPVMHFSKNLALLGGALALMGVDEPWPASVPMMQKDDDENRYEELLAA